jgi:hypothetical protein
MMSRAAKIATLGRSRNIAAQRIIAAFTTPPTAARRNPKGSKRTAIGSA